MSELQEHQFCECDEYIREYRGPLSNEMRPYYLKSEADKVIANQKYKRCLAMAKWCEMCHKELLTRACLPTKQNWNRHDEWRYFVDFWHRYEYRFRKLAEKFKEAK